MSAQLFAALMLAVLASAVVGAWALLAAAYTKPTEPPSRDGTPPRRMPKEPQPPRPGHPPGSGK